MPIHDQSYRRYGGGKAHARAAPGLVIARAGIMTHAPRSARSWACCSFAWVPFIVRAVQIYVTANYPQAAMLRADAPRRSASSSSSRTSSSSSSRSTSAPGLIANDRRANALQIYLSKPLMRTEYIAGKRRCCSRSCCSSRCVPALLLLLLQVLFAGSFAFLQNEPVPVPGDHRRARCCRRCSRRSRCWRCRRCRRAAATSASSTPASSSSRRRSTARCYAITGSTRAVVAVARREPDAGRRRHLPADAALRDARGRSRCIVILGLIALSISVLERRVRGVEVVT